MKPLARDGVQASQEPSASTPAEGSFQSSHEVLVEQLLGFLRQPLLDFLAREESRLTTRKLAAVAELAAGAAHEINTPLAVIVGEAQRLLKHEQDTERRRGLQKIVLKAKQIHQLFRDLLFFAEPPKPVLAQAVLRDLAQEAWSEVAPLARERKVRLRRPTRLARGTISADCTLLRTALAELFRNGIEAAPPGGWISFAIERRNGSIIFAVMDNGPGFTTEQKEHLFDPFYSGRSAGRGRGMGLAKVWRIAQLHGGQVLAFSRPKQPTRFEIHLPMHANLQPPEPAKNANGRKPNLSPNGVRRR